MHPVRLQRRCVAAPSMHSTGTAYPYGVRLLNISIPTATKTKGVLPGWTICFASLPLGGSWTLSNQGSIDPDASVSHRELGFRVRTVAGHTKKNCSVYQGQVLRYTMPDAPPEEWSTIHDARCTRRSGQRSPRSSSPTALSYLRTSAETRQDQPEHSPWRPVDGLLDRTPPVMLRRGTDGRLGPLTVSIIAGDRLPKYNYI